MILTERPKRKGESKDRGANAPSREVAPRACLLSLMKKEGLIRACQGVLKYKKCRRKTAPAHLFLMVEISGFEPLTS